MAETEFSRYSMFDFGLETPSKFVHGAGLAEGEATAMADWSTGLTPSLFKETKDGGSGRAEDENPFESLFHAKTGAQAFAGGADRLTPSGSTKHGLLLPTRKRALSSPALLTPSLGLTAFDFGEFTSAVAEDAKPFQPSSLSIATDSFGNTTKPALAQSSSSSGPSSLSPDSSTVLTPPDLALAFPSAEADGAKQHDIQVDFGQQYSAAPYATDAAALAMPYSQFFMPQLDQAQAQAQAAAAPGVFQVGAHFQPQPLPLAASPKTQAKKGASKPPAKLAATKKKAAKAESDAGSANGDEGSQVDAEEAEKRASHLERNRIAACKSRQKKKMKVNALETQAAEVSAQNAAIQQRALALQAEVFHLRALLDAHQGCDCEHVKGYLAREAAGGGIPTIQALAGQVLQLDYTKSPKLGSQADVYSQLGPAPPMMRPVIPITAPSHPVQIGAPIPLARARQAEQQQQQQPSLGMLTRSKGAANGTGHFEAAVLDRHAPAEMNWAGRRCNKPRLARSARSNSAPPARTPAWDVQPHAVGSYFPPA